MIFCLLIRNRIIEKNGGKAPLTYRQVFWTFFFYCKLQLWFLIFLRFCLCNQQFQNIIASVDAPPPPESDITFESIGRGYTPMDESMDDRFSVPTLEELGRNDRYFLSGHSISLTYAVYV